jgi:type II secretory pathway pseudopilin PulG
MQAAFSLIELVIGIIAILIAFLLFTLQIARQHALRLQCMNNLRQIGHGRIMYPNEQKHLPLRLGTRAAEGDYWGEDRGTHGSSSSQ